MLCTWQHRSVALEFACSSCRGIDVVRNKIKMFAQTKVTLPPGRHKMVILDEADRLVPVKSAHRPLAHSDANPQGAQTIWIASEGRGSGAQVACLCLWCFAGSYSACFTT